MRPLGVTLSAFFQFFRAFLLCILALGARFLGSVAARLASVASEGNAAQRFLSGFGHFLSMALLIYAVILIVLGLGLLWRQNWARSLTIIFSALGFLTLLPRLLHFHPFSFLLGMLNLLVLIYLLSTPARAFFTGKSTTEITTT
ncbi:MAG TPA: hypothetical protein VMH20_12560 [Verrucomicrobiae bacterium]|nr:hypothetical protein [Verrucomicrobiae bacterium]